MFKHVLGCVLTYTHTTHTHTHTHTPTFYLPSGGVDLFAGDSRPTTRGGHAEREHQGEHGDHRAHGNQSTAHLCWQVFTPEQYTYTPGCRTSFSYA